MTAQGDPKRGGATSEPPAAMAPDPVERRIRDFAEAASDWFWELDGDLRFTYMSGSVSAPSAEFARDFLGKRITEVRWRGLDQVEWAPLLEIQRARRPFRNFRLRRAGEGGALRHLSLSGVPIFDADGAFRGYRGVGRDITKEVTAEARAFAAHARLVNALESIPDAVLMLDAADRLVLCNSAYHRLYPAVSPKLVPGIGFEELCRAVAESGAMPDAIGRVEAWIEERMRRHRQTDLWIEERCVGGRWLQVTERPTPDGGRIVVQVDVSDLKRREQELGEKTQLLEATLENMEQGLLVLDAGLGIRAWNDRCVALLGLPPGAMAVGLPVEHLMRVIGGRGEYGPGDLDTIIARLMDQLARCDPPLLERERPDGSVIEQRRVRMPDGGILVTYTDVTKRKRVEADLRRARDEAELASRSKTEFLANMSHELRTPLNAVIGFSDVLAGEIFGPIGDRRYQEYAGDIRDSGRHLLNLINDVLDIAKIEHGTVELADEFLDVSALIESCARLMRERAGAAGVSLAVELERDLPAVRADSRRLKQILINLLSNAVKFTPAGGRVTVAAAADERGFRISVSDTGIGIATENLETALRPFGQIDSRLARKYQGTGLGLPLTKAMAELHGGSLELASTLGHGTTATVRLPPERVRFAMGAVAD